MGKPIKVDGSSVQEQVPVRRRNPQGTETENFSVSVPKELAQTINGIVVTTSKSRSLVITQLLEKGLKAEERK